MIIKLYDEYVKGNSLLGYVIFLLV